MTLETSGTLPTLSLLSLLKTREDVAGFLGIDDRYLRYILYVRKDRARYTEFSISKKGGGRRHISAPPKSLAFLQRHIATVLLGVHKPKPSAHGFLRDRSIVTNASQHTRQRIVFNLDLKDFFPTIHIGRVIKLLQKEPFELGGEAATVMCQICFDAAGKLPQGAASSPILSNLVCRSMDDSLQKLAERHGCRYTRYADDLTFSTSKPTISDAIAKRDSVTGMISAGPELSKIIEDASFAVNTAKIRLYKPERRQEVTGLTVNEDPNVRRHFIRELDSIIHCWRKHGRERAVQRYLKERRLPDRLAKERPDLLLQVLLGKIAFLKMVKGEHDPSPRRLQWALHDLEPEQVQKPSPIEELPSARLRGHVGKFRGWQAIGRRLSESVKFVQLLREGDVERVASAFVIGRNVLVTAGHVVSNPALRPRIGYDEDGLYPSSICYVDDRIGLDLALLFFSGSPFTEHAPFPFQYRLPEIGEEVIALGYPRIPFRQTTVVMHSGTVEALPVGLKGHRFIQTSFQSGGGLSGGPVIDKRGFVLGLMVENVFMRVPPEETFEPEKSGDERSDETVRHSGMKDVPGRAYGQAIPFEYAARARALLSSGGDKAATEYGCKLWKAPEGTDTLAGDAAGPV